MVNQLQTACSEELTQAYVSSSLPVLRTPYLIFLGDVHSNVLAKTGLGVKHWRPEHCLAQLRLDGCKADLGLPDMSIAEAAKMGAGSFLLGAAPDGGQIKAQWEPSLFEAVEHGLDIVSGLHTHLNDISALSMLARKRDVRLIDVRVPPKNIPVATGRKRTGNRLLTVGTDCAVGKKYTALSIEAALKARKHNATFRATGQTGIMITGEGIPMDSVISDFLSGAAECLTPDNVQSHWDIIEGQGSLYHPAYASVSLGLLLGSQPDALVLCHDATRIHIDDYPDFPIPSLNECMHRYEALAQLTNPNVVFVGVSLNTFGMGASERADTIARYEEETGLPCCDPVAGNVDPIIDVIDRRFR